MHKHIRIIAISKYMQDRGHDPKDAPHTRIPGIWRKLRSLYNLDAIDERVCSCHSPPSALPALTLLARRTPSSSPMRNPAIERPSPSALSHCPKKSTARECSTSVWHPNAPRRLPSSTSRLHQLRDEALEDEETPLPAERLERAQLKTPKKVGVRPTSHRSPTRDR